MCRGASEAQAGAARGILKRFAAVLDAQRSARERGGFAGRNQDLKPGKIDACEARAVQNNLPRGERHLPGFCEDIRGRRQHELAAEDLIKGGTVLQVAPERLYNL